MKHAKDMTPDEYDPLFRVEVIAKMGNPQLISYLAMHQDYSAGFVWDELQLGKVPIEQRAGEIVVNRCLKPHHFGVIEHAQIVFNFGGFPHSVLSQLRTHRTGISFDVCSGRYVSNHFLDVANNQKPVEEVIYFRPIGWHSDRNGKTYLYTEEHRENDKKLALSLCSIYADKIAHGYSEEHARGLLPYDVRQNFVMSCNLRTLCHLLDLRWKSDAQMEIQKMCDLVIPHFLEWCPEIAKHYIETRGHKGRLAP